jgi:5-methylcytosine-specific restriction endonuclease McrA
MKKSSIRKYLKRQPISSRVSTFKNAFASALADFDAYDDLLISQALTDLGQDPEEDLACVYCGSPAATWDHVHPRVSKGEYSGHGHTIRNLVPSCRTCNEKKGALGWRAWLEKLDRPDRDDCAKRMEKFLAGGPSRVPTLEHLRASAPKQFNRFLAVRHEVLALLKEADQLADEIRASARSE